jgi:hypothetical protein
MADFSIDCAYCPPPNMLMAFAPASGQEPEAFDAAWKQVADTYMIACPDCGSQYGLEDDPTGSVQRNNMSTPKIDSLNVGSGARTGGEALIIFGTALEVGDLVVKFGGKPAQAVTDRTATQARVVTPVGQYTLDVTYHLYKYTFASISGTFNAGDTITTTKGSSGKLHVVSGNDYWIGWTSLIGESPDAMVGEVFSSSGGGATQSVASSVAVDFIVGEGVRGVTSGAQGGAKTISPFVVDAPTASFADGELVIGTASGAYLYVSAPAYSGYVDVTVENEYGQRADGGAVVDGFAYL